MLTFAKIEEQIAVLLGEADKLRPLAEDDPLKLPLALIVDKINALRALQDKSPRSVVEQGENPPNWPGLELPAEKPKRGRPAKVDA